MTITSTTIGSRDSSMEASLAYLLYRRRGRKPGRRSQEPGARSRNKDRNASAILAPGYWLLAPGYWLLAPGYWLLPLIIPCFFRVSTVDSTGKASIVLPVPVGVSSR